MYVCVGITSDPEKFMIERGCRFKNVRKRMWYEFSNLGEADAWLMSYDEQEHDTREKGLEKAPLWYGYYFEHDGIIGGEKKTGEDHETDDRKEVTIKRKEKRV